MTVHELFILLIVQMVISFQNLFAKENERTNATGMFGNILLVFFEYFQKLIIFFILDFFCLLSFSNLKREHLYFKRINQRILEKKIGICWF